MRRAMVCVQRIDRMELRDSTGGEVASRVTIPQELAWRVFTKGIDRDSARARIEIEGKRELGDKALL